MSNDVEVGQCAEKGRGLNERKSSLARSDGSEILLVVIMERETQTHWIAGLGANVGAFMQV